MSARRGASRLGTKDAQILLRLTAEDLARLDAFVAEEAKRTGYDLGRATVVRSFILRALDEAAEQKKGASS